MWMCGCDIGAYYQLLGYLSTLSSKAQLRDRATHVTTICVLFHRSI